MFGDDGPIEYDASPDDRFQHGSLEGESLIGRQLVSVLDHSRHDRHVGTLVEDDEIGISTGGEGTLASL